MIVFYEIFFWRVIYSIYCNFYLYSILDQQKCFWTPIMHCELKIKISKNILYYPQFLCNNYLSSIRSNSYIYNFTCSYLSWNVWKLWSKRMNVIKIKTFYFSILHIVMKIWSWLVLDINIMKILHFLQKVSINRKV